MARFDEGIYAAGSAAVDALLDRAEADSIHRAVPGAHATLDASRRLVDGYSLQVQTDFLVGAPASVFWGAWAPASASARYPQWLFARALV